MHKIAIILRGHIRKSFENKKLYDIINSLVKIYNIDIYIHTWNEYEAKKSWRPLDNTNTNIVTIDAINDYFNNCSINIKKIIIDNDENIELIGLINGNIGKTLMPKLSWKKMWYGINKITSDIYFNFSTIKYETVLCTRFDNIDIAFSINLGYNLENIINMIDKFQNNKLLYNSDLILFMNNHYCKGIDNFYIGSIDSLYLLHKKFHEELDEILNKNNNNLIKHQEYIVFSEANNKIIPKEKISIKNNNTIKLIKSIKK